MTQKLHILDALQKIGEKLMQEEEDFLQKNSEKSMKNFSSAKVDVNKKKIYTIKDFH